MRLLIHRIILLALLAILALSSALAESLEERKARDAAKDWLALVDAEDYAASWEQAASLFKKKVGKEQWEKMAAGARRPLGELQSRELAGAQRMKELPGAPDGDYVVIKYRARFANKATAVETVTPMLDSDGQWRVSGYFIK